ncbi:hypothetical protein D3C85_1151740 [compost metagenome]
MHRGFDVIPLFIMLEIRFFIVMLHVEQPDARHAGEEEHWSLNQQKRLPTYAPTKQYDTADDPNVGDVRVKSFFHAYLPTVKPVINEEDKNRSNNKHHERTAIQPVGHTFQPRGLHIFIHGKRPNVTYASAIQISAGSMVNGVRMTPLVVRYKG